METGILDASFEQLVQSITVEDARRIVELQIGDYSNIRSRYNDSLTTAIQTYMTTDQAMKIFVAVMVAAVISSWGATEHFLRQDAEFDSDMSLWYTEQLRAEEANVRKLARNLSAVKATGKFDVPRLTDEHVRGYVRGLDRIFNNLHVASAGAHILTFGGISGDENCKDCAELQGQSHTARWWWETDSIPPNRRFRCGGWKCQHYLYDMSGRLYTI